MDQRCLYISILELSRVVAETEVEAVVVPVLHVTLVQAFPPDIPYKPCGSAMTAVYEELVDWISQEALAGDRDAAELVIICLVAKV